MQGLDVEPGCAFTNMAAMNHVFSCGGGVQSTACLVLAAQGRIPYRTFVFANVGNQAESPDTIEYIPKVLKPYAAKHGIEWVDLQRKRRDGTPVDLTNICIALFDP
jgi:3'-phosphoadenosine 5'-phosphosulfate sulfotransferase (PAPS reductase)/FAD synthetase